MSFILKIRAHHLLCLQGYQGYGYSESFKANLEKIIKLIHTTSDLVIEVVTENDLICEHCPYTDKTGCQKDENSSLKIKSMDLKVLEKLGLQEGVMDKSQNLINLINTKLKTYFDIEEICGNCQWKEKCLWFQKLLI